MKSLLKLFALLLVVTVLNAQDGEKALEDVESGPPAEPEEVASSPASEDGDSESEATTPASEVAEGSSPGSSAEGEEEPKEGGSPASEGPKPEEGKGSGGGGGSYKETYDKVTQLLKDAEADVSSVEDEYLKRTVENVLQGYLINPIVDQTGQIAEFDAIKDCFKTLAEEVKKHLSSYKESFTTCKADKPKDSGSYECSSQDQSSFTDNIASLQSTISSCVSSNRKD